MKLSGKEIRHLEDLARIELDPGERERLCVQLERIIDFVRVLREASGPVKRQTPNTVDEKRTGVALAADLPGECLDRDEVLAAAPESEDGFFSVPPVLETDRS